MSLICSPGMRWRRAGPTVPRFILAIGEAGILLRSAQCISPLLSNREVGNRDAWCQVRGGGDGETLRDRQCDTDIDREEFIPALISQHLILLYLI